MRLILVLISLVWASAIQAATLGDDGLHKASWMRDTFKDLREDLADANAEGKRLVLMFEQRGCIYCTKMHEEIYPRPEIHSYIEENFYVVQLNMHGDLDVTDFDGDVQSEKDIARKWGLLFTPMVMFMPKEVPEGLTAPQAAVAVMPGAFGPSTTLDMYTWVNEERYNLDGDEDFQRYHARRISERQAQKNKTK